MGYLYVPIKIPKIITFAFVVNSFAQIIYFLIGLLAHLGLFKQPPQEQDQEDQSTTNPRDNYVLILDGLSPSLVPVPVHVVTNAIKNRVPIVSYQDFIQKQEKEDEISCGGDDDDDDKVCRICLDCVEGEHEIRELCNCRHVFHRECLDSWIDQGHISCPLCRSMLLPPRINLSSCNLNRDTGVVQSDARLSTA